MVNITKIFAAILVFCWLGIGEAQKWTSILGEDQEPAPVKLKVVASDASGITVEITLPGFNSWEEKVGAETYQHLEIKGGGFTADIGSPELPAISTHLEVPFGAEAAIELEDSQSKVMSAYNIYPVQEPWPNIDQVKRPPFSKNDEVYTTNAFFPEQLVQVSKAGELRGYRVVFLALFPVQYNPVSKELKVYSSLKVRLNYTDVPVMTDALEESAMQSKAKFNRDFEPIYKASILNYQPPAPEVMDIIDAPREIDALGADYLIITHDDYYTAMLPLKTHRETADGFLVEITKLSDIPPGDANAIKNYIQNAYKRWRPAPAYVLLVGDADYLPTNYVTNHPSSYEDNERTGTDLYYSTVDGSDYIPDLFMGRLPVDSEDQAKLMVDRIIKYETNPSDETCMFTRVLLAAYDEPGRFFVPTCEEIAKYLSTQSYNCTKVYTGGTYSGTTSDVINAINKGVFLVIHRDHGNSMNAPQIPGPDGWGHPSFNTTHIPSLSNGKMLPVMFSMNCRSGWFDGETDEDAAATVTDCFGEMLLRYQKGGVIGYFGATRISYSGYNDQLTDGFVDAIWPDFNPTVGSSTSLNRLGQVLNQGKSYMYDTYVLTGGAGYPWTPTPLYTLTEYEEFHLLGDPAMKIRTKKCKDYDNNCCGKGGAFAFVVVPGYILINLLRNTRRKKVNKEKS